MRLPVVAGQDAVSVGEPAKSHETAGDVGSSGDTMAGTENQRSPTHRLLQWMPAAIALVLIVSMLSEREEWLYVAAVLGILASLAVGRTLGAAEKLVWRAQMGTFAKGWGVVVILAAFSLFHGKWQPMVFFTVVGIISSAFFLLGSKSSR